MLQRYFGTKGVTRQVASYTCVERVGHFGHAALWVDIGFHTGPKTIW